MSERKITPLAIRFQKYVSPPNKTGCMMWRGHTIYGYGYIRRGRAGEGTARAHRVAWELAHGPIPKGMQVLHRCDNPGCVNVEHLFLGTDADNMADKKTKNRAAKPKGMKHPHARLNDAMVRQIRQKYAAGGTSYRRLAREFGVKFATISDVVRRRQWSHIA